MFLVHFCREYRSDLTCDYMFPLGTRERNNLVPRFRVTLAQRNGIWERDCNYSCNIYACWLQLFIYLFIHLFINFAKRPHKASSITRPREEKRKEKRKLEIQILMEWQYFRNDKKQQWKTELGRTLIKNQQLIRSSKLFSGRLVWHLIHTLLKVCGVSTSVRHK